MISIVNITDDIADEMHQYVLSINYDVIVYFQHRRKDGLENCLLAAAEAVKQKLKE